MSRYPKKGYRVQKTLVSTDKRPWKVHLENYGAIVRIASTHRSRDAAVESAKRKATDDCPYLGVVGERQQQE